MKIVKPLIFLPVTVVLSQSALAQDASTPGRQNIELEKPYELVITGRPTRGHLRRLIVEVQDDFFARFNELNHDDAFDMRCYKYTPTMTHISRRACEPLFIIKERERNASDTAFSLSQPYAITFLESPRIMRNNLQSQYEILVNKMEELARQDKQLGDIRAVMAELYFRLETYGDR